MTAADEDATVVRWITRAHNYRARFLYDDVAEGTDWITYDMAPAVGGAAQQRRGLPVPGMDRASAGRELRIRGGRVADLPEQIRGFSRFGE